MQKFKNNLQWGNLILVILLAALLVSACTAKPAQKNTLKFAVLPIIDSLPMYVAQQEGLFGKHNLEVELIPVSSGPERDQLVAAGQIDGMINEVLTTIMNNRAESNVQIVRFARAATADTALFSIIASQKSGITDVEQLKNVPVGISEGTVIAYLTDRMLQREGFSAEEIQTIAVPKIPDRLALLNSGELQAGTMPEPLATLLSAQGASVVLADSKYPDLSYSTIAFRKAILDENPQAVKNFLAAIEEAVQIINNDPAKWEETLVNNKILPPPLQGKFTVPQFVSAGVPSEAQYADVLSWAKEKNMLSEDVPYERCVNATFLPE